MAKFNSRIPSSVIVPLVGYFFLGAYAENFRNDKDLKRTSSKFQCETEGLIADRTDCSIFYRCLDWGEPSDNSLQTRFTSFKFQCGDGLVFDLQQNSCVHASITTRSECQHDTSEPLLFNFSRAESTMLSDDDTNEHRHYGAAQPHQESNFPPYSLSYHKLNVDSSLGPISDIDNAIGEQPLRITRSPSCSTDGFFPVENDCTRFYRCVANGKGFNKYEFSCGEGTVWDPDNNVCNHAWAVQREDCKNNGSGENNPSGSPNPNESGGNPNPEEGEGNPNPNEGDPSGGEMPNSNSSPNPETDPNTNSSPGYPNPAMTEYPQPNPPDYGNNPPNSEGNNHTSNSSMCPSEGFHPVQNNCKKFIRCVYNGHRYTKFEFECAEGTVWDKDVETCNYPEAVERSDCKADQDAPSTGNEADDNSGTTSNLPVTTNDSQTSSTSSEQNSSGTTSHTASSSQQSSSTASQASSQSSSTSQQTSSTSSHQTSSSSSSQQTSSTASQSSSSSSQGSTTNSMQQNTSSTASGQQTSSTSSGQQTSSTSGQQTSSTSSGQQSSSSSSGQQTSSTSSGQQSSSSSSQQTSSTSSGNNNQTTTNQQGTNSTSGADHCTSEGFFPSSKSCNKFYRCVPTGNNGYTKYDFDCGPGTVFDPDYNVCNHPWAVRDEKCRSGDSSGGSQSSTSPLPNEETKPVEPTTDVMPTTPSSTTSKPGQSKPTSSKPTSTSKPNTTTSTGSSRPSSTTSPGGSNNTSTTKRPSTTTTTKKPGTNSSTTPSNTTNTTPGPSSNETTSISNPNNTTEAPCQNATKPTGKVTCTKAGFYPYPGDCKKFYRCVDWDGDKGERFSVYYFDCPEGTIFDPSLSTCNHEESVYPPRDCSNTGNSTTEPTSATETAVNPVAGESTTTNSTEPFTESTTSSSEATTPLPTEVTTNSAGETTPPTTSSTVTEPGTTFPSSTGTSIINTSESTTSASNQITSTVPSPTDITTTMPSTSANERCPEMKPDQFAIVCPTGFRRHPKYCNIFYQCTTSPNHEIKVLTLSCTNGTVYDDKKIQCLPPDQAKECDGSMVDMRNLRQLTDDSIAPIPVKSDKTICPSEGSFSYKDDCRLFYKCKKDNEGQLNGFIYQCPEGFGYWSISKRCEKIQKIPCGSKKSVRNPSLAPIESRNLGHKK